MAYNTAVLRRIALFSIAVVIGMVLIDVIVAGVLGISDAIIVAATVVLLGGYGLLTVLGNCLSGK